MFPSSPAAHQPATGAAGLVTVMCLAQVLIMLGVFAFPALLPQFSRDSLDKGRHKTAHLSDWAEIYS